MRLIDSDALTARLKAIRIRSKDLTIDYKRGHSDGIITAVEYADNALGIYADSFRPYGEWVEDYAPSEDPRDRIRYKCSECGRIEERKEPYCNCGARMEHNHDSHQ